MTKWARPMIVKTDVAIGLGSLLSNPQSSFHFFSEDLPKSYFIFFLKKKRKHFQFEPKALLVHFLADPALCVSPLLYIFWCANSRSSSKVRVSACVFVRVCACACVRVLWVRSRSVYKTGAYILHQLNRKPQAEDPRESSKKLSRFSKIQQHWFSF